MIMLTIRDGPFFFCSWNVGPAHIISISTEFYFYHNYGAHQMANQFKWLEADLKVMLCFNSS